jgi:formylglycine-generating enzyme required for sulfatase activity
MRVVAAAAFTMGSDDGGEDEKPAHRVALARAVAVGTHEVTRGEFERFIAATGHTTPGPCNVLGKEAWEPKDDVTWRAPGFDQDSSHPVVCVSWNDAVEYTAWLSRLTGKKYRLLSEAEWEYLARSPLPSAPSADGRVTHDQANFGAKECCGPKVEGRDRWTHTAPVGSFAPNALGLRDLQGNVWEWVADCYHESYVGAPADGTARTQGCSMPDWRGVRGGGWGDDAIYLRPSYRLRAKPENRYFTLGFRVARDM